MYPAVSFQGVSRHFGPVSAPVKAVDEVDLTIAEGAFFAMLGPSGSGKTTCLRLISGFESPTAGEICIFGPPGWASSRARVPFSIPLDSFCLMKTRPVRVQRVDRGRAHSTVVNSWA